MVQENKTKMVQKTATEDITNQGTSPPRIRIA